MQKVLLTFFAVLALFFSSSAQTFEVSLDGLAITDTVFIYDDVTSPEIVFNPVVTNLTDQTLKVKIRRTNVDTVTGTSNYFCWDACYPAFIDESGYRVMDAGTSLGPDIFTAHYEPHEKAGTSIVKYFIFNMDDESMNTTVVVAFKGSPAAIDESVLRSVEVSNIYPNPASSFVNLNYSFTTGVQTASVRMMNLLGVVVAEYPMNTQDNELRMDVSKLNGGIYFYSVVVNGEVVSSRKLIVN